MKALVSPGFILFCTLVALAIAFVLVVYSIVVNAKFTNGTNWTALAAIASLFAAIGTVSAVLVALFYPIYQEWRERPILEISPFELESPHIAAIPEKVVVTRPDPKTGEPKATWHDGTSYKLILQLTNSGKSIAKSAEPLVTALRTKEDNSWKTEDPWIPIPLRGVYDKFKVDASPEKDLVPYKPYFFNVGRWHKGHATTFFLIWFMISSHQSEEYQKGEYCFEITAFALGAKSVKKYVHMKWDGVFIDNLEEFKEHVEISLINHWPP